MIKRRLMAQLFLSAVPALVLSSCSNMLGPPPAGTIYPVAPVFAPSSQVPPAVQKVSWALSILPPDMAAGLDTDRIALLQADGTMNYYASATYPESLPGVVQSALLAGFETSGRIAAVARDQDGLHADYELLTEVKNFQALYSEPNGIPQATVTILVKLVSVHGRDILGTFTASHTETASANATLAVAQALQKALAAVVTSIVDWTLAAPKPAAAP